MIGGETTLWRMTHEIMTVNNDSNKNDTNNNDTQKDVKKNDTQKNGSKMIDTQE